MNNKYFIQPKKITKHQSGVVLVISLIMLLALTLIGVTSSNVTGLEEKMAANSKDVNLAFQAAEAALRAAEASLKTLPTAFNGNAARTTLKTSQGTGGYYTLLNGDEVIDPAGALTSPPTLIDPPPQPPFYESVDWTGNKVIPYSKIADEKKLIGLSHAPVCIIEELSSAKAGSAGNMGYDEAGAQKTTPPGQVHTYRITAHGWGSNENSVVTVQSTVKVQY